MFFKNQYKIDKCRMSSLLKNVTEGHEQHDNSSFKISMRIIWDQNRFNPRSSIRRMSEPLYRKQMGGCCANMRFRLCRRLRVSKHIVNLSPTRKNGTPLGPSWNIPHEGARRTALGAWARWDNALSGQCSIYFVETLKRPFGRISMFAPQGLVCFSII